ncbi:hypothetical protein KEM48_002144 [Puccinia striiformis f. sp. tritici PST-130]|nr:hypothetical protein KEM48_002144 [Puccinia striiformis f. sp. tritici PST-130]
MGNSQHVWFQVINGDDVKSVEILAQRLIEARWGSVEDTQVPDSVFEDIRTCVED